MKIASFAGYFVGMALCLGAVQGMAAENAHVIRAAVVARDEGKGVADLLTVALSKQADTEVLERAAIAKILDEQSLAGANLSDPNSVKIGQLLKAEIIVLLQKEPGADTKTNLRCKIISVHPGVVLESLSVPLPIKDASGLVKMLDEDVARLRPKLLAKRHILLSVSKFKTVLRKKDSLDQETALHGLLIERLSCEPSFFVAERQDTGALLFEQTESPESMPATVMVEGTIEESLEPKTPVQIHVYLRPKTGAALEFRISGTWDDLPTLVDATARRLVKELNATESSLARWEPDKEAAYYTARAKWLLDASSYDDALAAVDAACFLGKTTVDLERLRVDLDLHYFFALAQSPFSAVSWESGRYDGYVNFNHKTVCGLMIKNLDLIQHMEQLWLGDHAEPRKASSCIFFNVNGQHPPYGTRMHHVLAITRLLAASGLFAWQDELRKDPEAKELWSQIFQQYRRLRLLTLPQDPRQALFVKVQEADVMCDTPEEMIALIDQAWADSLSQPEPSGKRLDGLKPILDFARLPCLNLMTDLRKKLLAVAKQHVETAPTAMTRRYWEIVAGCLGNPDVSCSVPGDPRLAFSADTLIPNPTAAQLNDYLQEFTFMDGIGNKDEARARYIGYFWDHRDKFADVPSDHFRHVLFDRRYLSIPEIQKWGLWKCDHLGKKESFTDVTWAIIPEIGYFMVHSNNDFCCVMHEKIVAAEGRKLKNGGSNYALAFIEQYHPELKEKTPVVLDSGKLPDNFRLTPSIVWSVNNMPWAKKNYAFHASAMMPLESDAFWSAYSCFYEREEEHKTFLLRISVPDLKTETIECPNIDGYEYYGSQHPTWYGLAKKDSWILMLHNQGILRMDCRSHEVTKKLFLNAEKLWGSLPINHGWGFVEDGPVVVNNKVLQPVLLVDSGNGLDGGGYACGIQMIDLATMKDTLVVSGLRDPPQTPLDYPSHRYIWVHANTNGEAFLVDDYKNEKHMKCYVYNVTSNTWHEVTKEERNGKDWEAWAKQAKENDWRDLYALKCAPQTTPDKILPDLAPDAIGWYFWDCQAKTTAIVIELRDGKKISVPIDVILDKSARVVTGRPNPIPSDISGGIVTPQGVFLVVNGISFIPMENIRKYIKWFVLKSEPPRMQELLPPDVNPAANSPKPPFVSEWTKIFPNLELRVSYPNPCEAIKYQRYFNFLVKCEVRNIGKEETPIDQLARLYLVDETGKTNKCLHAMINRSAVVRPQETVKWWQDGRALREGVFKLFVTWDGHDEVRSPMMPITITSTFEEGDHYDDIKRAALLPKIDSFPHVAVNTNPATVSYTTVVWTNDPVNIAGGLYHALTFDVPPEGGDFVLSYTIEQLAGNKTDNFIEPVDQPYHGAWACDAYDLLEDRPGVGKRDDGVVFFRIEREYLSPGQRYVYWFRRWAGDAPSRPVSINVLPDGHSPRNRIFKKFFPNDACLKPPDQIYLED